MPGLRDLRTPLINGYLWLAAIWVAAEQFGAVPDPQTSFVKRLTQLLDLEGPAAKLVVLSFSAYILGGLVAVRTIGPGSRADSAGKRNAFSRLILASVNVPVSLTLWIRTWARNGTGSLILERWAIDQVGALPRTQGLSKRIAADRELPERLRVQVLAALALEEPEAELLELTRVMTHWVKSDEIGALRVRLRLERETLFQDHDRLVSEGELRCSIYFPIALLIAEGALWQTPWLWPLLIVPIALLMDGLQVDNQSREILYEALAVGAISSPAMARLRDIGATEDQALNASQSQARDVVSRVLSSMTRIKG